MVPDGAAGALAKRVKELTALYEFTKRLFDAKSPSDVYDAALDAVLTALNCERASILLFDEAGTMRFVAWRGLSDEYRSAVEGHSPWAVNDQAPRPICIADVAGSDLPEALKTAAARERIGALAFIPLVARARLIGTCVTYQDRARPYGEEEIELALTIARQLGFAIERNRAEDASHGREAALEGIVDQAPFMPTRLQQQLADAQKMEALGQLTGGVAHDFNNLLMIVGGYAQMLKKHAIEPRAARAIEAIQAAVSRGEGLTRQLLSFSRRQPLDPVIVHPAEAVAAIRDALFGSIHVNIDVTIDIPQRTWPICVDRSEFALALVNIAVNASDSMPAGGRLSISAANVGLDANDGPDGLSGDYIALKIADSGAGIRADVLPRVFEPFFTTKALHKGTGLGLSQVYSFARRSGGSVVITSEINRGTTVTMYLPRSHVAPTLSQQSSVHRMAGRREMILIVEDNPDVRAVVVMLLEQLGYGTITADSGPAALHVLASDPRVDLVFTDVVLPGAFDGLALAQSLGALRPDLPVVLTTGYAKRLDDEPGFPVLRKPYDIAALARVVREAIDERPSERARETAMQSAAG